jgi:tRNA threonylcarbamoyladenosine biosynthesis protein TsaB
LEKILREQNLAMPQFDLYAVAGGPGSFTGVRVGLAAVKAWAEVFAKPVAAVSGLEAVAFQGPVNLVPGKAPLLAAVTDARRGQLYAGLYQREEGALRRRGEDVVMSPAECFAYLAAQAGDENICFVTPAPEWLAELLASSRFRGAAIATASAILAPSIGQLGLERARAGETQDALSLDAHYVRCSDAEVFGKPR